MTTQSRQVRVTYYDTAMALLEVGSLRLLTDPVLDGAGSGFDYGPVHLEKTGPARTTAAALGHIDAVLLSHDQHGDNLDRAGRLLLHHVPLVITTPLAASRLDGVAAAGLDPWSSNTLTGADGFALTVTAVPAQHGPDGTLDATGPVTGFLLIWPDGGEAIYVSGDTVPFAGTREIAERAAPVGLALLNIGRVRLAPMGDASLSLGAEQAVAYATALRARHVVPLHFEGWRHFSETADVARAVFAASPIADHVVWLEAGETHVFDLQPPGAASPSTAIR